MLIDLFSKEQSYNVEVAKRFDINTAVYLNAILKIQKRALDSGFNYFSATPDYILDETGLLEEEQIICHYVLKEVGIIEENENGCRMSLDTLISIFNSNNESLVADLSKITKAANKKEKADYQVEAVKRYVNLQKMPSNLKEAYCKWLDMVKEKLHYSNRELFLQAQRDIEGAAKGDTNLAIDILTFATANCWRKTDYAVEEYFKRKVNTRLKGNVVVENAEVKKDIAF